MPSKVIDPFSDDSLLYLGVLGGNFTPYAATQLLSRYSCYSETRYWMLISALRRHDKKGALQYLKDWSTYRKPSKMVSKFTPGTHYYVDSNKFESLELAKTYLSEIGFEFGGLNLVR